MSFEIKMACHALREMERDRERESEFADRRAGDRFAWGRHEAASEAIKNCMSTLRYWLSHVHVNRGDGTDTCAHCGLDLRDAIHARSEHGHPSADPASATSAGTSGNRRRPG